MPIPLCSSPPRPRSLLAPTLMSLSSSSLSNSNPDPIGSFPLSSSNLEIIGARRSLLSKFESLRKPYKPYPLVAWNRHVETIFASFFRSLPAVTFRRECLRTKDNGAVALDWVSADDRQLPFESPVLILLGMTVAGCFAKIIIMTRIKTCAHMREIIGKATEECKSSYH